MKIKIKEFMTKKRFVRSEAWKKRILVVFLLIVNSYVYSNVYRELPEIKVTIGEASMPLTHESPVQVPKSKPSEVVVVKEEKKVVKKVIATTYNAEVAQTDSDPYTMASGKRVYEGAVASNCYPFGTKIEISGLGIFTVDDRMNSRFTELCGTEKERIDIFRWNKKDNFRKEIEYTV